MTLTAGTRFGAYQVLSQLGAGGMGAVYRAVDSKLGREVALKLVLPEFAKDEQRMGRFQREAQLLASLNHPNIASIYGLEDSGGVSALVMELVEGPTLEERMKTGPLPPEEALPIARQIADALEYAHEHGIVHRDLKPANIKLTSEGKVKVLDFGLAKAVQGDATSRSSSDSPTLTQATTKAGIILGTAAYMSPEQAKGKLVDRRTDIWAFGVVFFEMLTGIQLYAGETTTDVLAAVIRAEPDWNLLPVAVPRHVRRLLERCLVKDERRRLRDIGEARLALEEDGARDGPGPATSPPNRVLGALPWAVAVIAIVALTVVTRRDSAATQGEVMHLDVAYPSDIESVSGLQGGFAISPDGRKITLIGIRDGVRRLFVRRLDRPEVAEVPDSSGVNASSFSPDSSSIVFAVGGGQVTRVSLVDQQRTVLALGADLTGGVAWVGSEVIFSRGGELWNVPARGGEARRLTVLDGPRHEVLHNDPTALPGGHVVLFSSMTSESGTERIEAVDLDSRKRVVVIEHAVSAAWSPSGHLLFGRDGAVWAVPFDPKDLTPTGAAVPVIPSGTVARVRSGSLGFQVSSTGVLLYLPSDYAHERVVSVGRDGSELPLDLPPDRYGNPRISPDGKRLLVTAQESFIETVDLARGTHARLAAASIGTSFPSWTADGSGVVYKRFNVPFWAAADGTGKESPVPSGQISDFPSAPGPDPDTILEVRIQPESSGDLYLMSISGKFPPKPLVSSSAYEGGPQLSPDGHWLLYQSNGSGQPEIYLRRYPELDRQWQVSEGGGVQPRWSRTGREIFYRGGTHLMAVAVNGSGAEPSFDKPAALFTDDYDFGYSISIANYDTTRDGRFVMLRHSTHGSNLHAVFNFPEELRQVLAAGGVR